jgi:hypothetical protein
LHGFGCDCAGREDGQGIGEGVSAENDLWGNHAENSGGVRKLETDLSRAATNQTLGESCCETDTEFAKHRTTGASTWVNPRDILPNNQRGERRAETDGPTAANRMTK